MSTAEPQVFQLAVFPPGRGKTNIQVILDRSEADVTWSSLWSSPVEGGLCIAAAMMQWCPHTLKGEQYAQSVTVYDPSPFTARTSSVMREID